jgi:hypothetical protein
MRYKIQYMLRFTGFFSLALGSAFPAMACTDAMVSICRVEGAVGFEHEGGGQWRERIFSDRPEYRISKRTCNEKQWEQISELRNGEWTIFASRHEGDRDFSNGHPNYIFQVSKNGTGPFVRVLTFGIFRPDQQRTAFFATGTCSPAR